MTFLGALDENEGSRTVKRSKGFLDFLQAVLFFPPLLENPTIAVFVIIVVQCYQ